MADDYPARRRPVPIQPGDRSDRSQYPPPPRDGDDSARVQLPAITGSNGAMTLPSFQYAAPSAQACPPPSDQPSNGNGWGPDHQQQARPYQPTSPHNRAPGSAQLPPTPSYAPQQRQPQQHPQQMPQTPPYAPVPPGQHLLPAGQHPLPGGEQRPEFRRSPYGPDPYYGQVPHPPPNDRGPSQPAYQPSAYGDAYRPQAPPPSAYGEYYQQVQPPPQAAPRQRTSIACRYCRKRKIRCSGYNQASNGKCTNCDKLRIECIFQPVSSNASAAFVPVGALQGRLQPGTQLYGSYGEPLPQSISQSVSNAVMHHQQQQQQQPAPYGEPQNQYPPGLLQSPTGGSYPSLPPPPPPPGPRDDRESRRRSRPLDEVQEARLPPPNYPPDQDPRRRSPVTQNAGTPPSGYPQYAPNDFQYPPPQQQQKPQLAPRQQQQQQQPPQQQQQQQKTQPEHQYPPPQQARYDGEKQAQNTPLRSSPSYPPPPPQQQSGHSPQTQGFNNPMSLTRMIAPGGSQAPSGALGSNGSEIDRNMLGRLNGRRQKA